MTAAPFPHVSVLLEEIKSSFSFSNIKIFFDGTLGAGGHAEAILQSHPEIELYLGVDQDPDALTISEDRLRPWRSKLELVRGNFSEIDQILESRGIDKINGALVDLGVSSMQLDRAERGFSFSQAGPLDMRMNPLGQLTAADIVNTWPEDEIGRVFREYGEEKKWRIAARSIVEARKHALITSTQQIVTILRPVLYNPKRPGINPLTLIFQALRICVNRELDVLEAFMPRAIERLSPGGRLAVISFHSLEDRIVKNEMRFAASDKWETEGIGGLFRDKEPIVDLITRKPICATEDEVRGNSRSRSAKLRVVEKITN